MFYSETIYYRKFCTNEITGDFGYFDSISLSLEIDTKTKIETEIKTKPECRSWSHKFLIDKD